MQQSKQPRAGSIISFQMSKTLLWEVLISKMGRGERRDVLGVSSLKHPVVCPLPGISPHLHNNLCPILSIEILKGNSGIPSPCWARLTSKTCPWSSFPRAPHIQFISKLHCSYLENISLGSRASPFPAHPPWAKLPSAPPPGLLQ